jgi:hypothetical protein
LKIQVWGLTHLHRLLGKLREKKARIK